MKIVLTTGRGQRGFTTLVVMILLILMSVLLVSNSRTIHQLEMELDLLDAKQVQKYQPVPAKQQKSKPITP